jgi:hypothetical protein
VKGNFIEIGSADGVTARVISDNLPALTLLCIDNFAHDPDVPNAAHNDPHGDRFRNWMKNRTDRMHLYDGTFELFVKRNNTDERHALRKPDLHILVDGDHSYEGVLADLNMCNKLDFYPVIYCHDYGDPYWTGVQKAVDDFVEHSQYQIVKRCNSLVTLRAGVL